MVNFVAGDLIEVSEEHDYFYNRGKDWIYLGRSGRNHSVMSIDGSEEFNHIWTETMYKYFKLKAPLFLENK